MKRRTIYTILTFVFTAAVVLLVFGCSPATSDPSVGDGVDPTLTAEWSMGSDCASCHPNEKASATDNTRLYATHVSMSPETIECVYCHTDDDGKLTTAHASTAGKQAPTKLRTTAISSDTCLGSCHEQGELITATADYDRLTDPYGTTVNPHDIPQNADHDAEITCSSCHNMHKAGDVFSTARSHCLSCHHAGVYECYTCHD